MQGFAVIAALQAVGLLTSGFLALQHFGLVGSGSICEMGSSLSCSRVLGSEWARLLGVPLAVHGLVYFAVALACAGAAHLYDGRELRVSRHLAMANVGCCAVGCASVAYFLYGEFALGALCPLCTVVHLVVVASLVLALRCQRQGGYKDFWSFDSWTDFCLTNMRFILIAVGVAFLPLILFNLPPMHPSYEASQTMALAKCLTARGVRMYGAKGCSHCTAQQVLFGPEAFASVDYVNCLDEKNESVCKDAKITGYPTWVMGDQRKSGTTALLDLAKWSDCTDQMKV